jgi:long-chain acyl-CoA synthetase
MLSPESCFQCPRYYSSNTFPAGKEKAELPSCLLYFERAALYLYQYHGVSVYFGERKISDNLKEVKPTMITAVPRLLEKVYDKKSMQKERS